MPVQTDEQKKAAYAAGGVPAPTTPSATPTTPPATSPAPAPSNEPTGTTAPSGGATQLSSGSQTATMPASGSIVDLLNQGGQGSSYADRQKLAQQFGIAGYHGTAAQNTDLAKKYLAYFNSKKGTEAPATNPRTDIQQATDGTQKQPDPQQNFIDQYASMNPAIKTMYDMIHQVLSPQATQQTFTQEYQSLIAAQGIPALQTNLMNIQNVMNGTEDDIRTEVTKAGGLATESQVQALAATRNKVLLKQANTMSQTLQMKEDYVNQVMQFSQADRVEVDKQVNEKIGLVEKMATIQDTINKNAQGNYQKIVDNLGYTGLAKAFAESPQGAAQAERLLSLPQGALTDQAWLSQADTLRQQTLSARTGQYDITNALAKERLNQGQQKINITIGQANAGVGSTALQGMLDVYNTTGQIPSFGMGVAGQGMRKAFYAAIAGEGTSGVSSAASNKVMLAGATNAMRVQQTQYRAAQTSLGTIDKQLGLLATYSAKVDRSGSPVFNKYALFLKGKVQGDVDTQALQNIVQTASYEFAKILSGASASIAGVTVTSAQDAQELLNANMTKGQITKIIDLMKQESNFRLTSQKASIDQIQSDIKSMGQNTNTGATKIYQGHTYVSDGNQWTLQK